MKGLIFLGMLMATIISLAQSNSEIESVTVIGKNNPPVNQFNWSFKDLGGKKGTITLEPGEEVPVEIQIEGQASDQYKVQIQEIFLGMVESEGMPCIFEFDESPREWIDLPRIGQGRFSIQLSPIPKKPTNFEEIAKTSCWENARYPYIFLDKYRLRVLKETAKDAIYEITVEKPNGC